ncbi:MAG: hypothetical protein OXI27_02585 [Thaumarchaeota archaeon]|nr:hypothetical protein [Nitrososphaerota archaeon]
MTPFSFFIVKSILRGIGFNMEMPDGIKDIAIFGHPAEETSVLLAHHEMDEVYLRTKMSEIHLPYGYFVSMAKAKSRRK